MSRHLPGEMLLVRNGSPVLIERPDSGATGITRSVSTKLGIEHCDIALVIDATLTYVIEKDKQYVCVLLSRNNRLVWIEPCYLSRF